MAGLERQRKAVTSDGCLTCEQYDADTMRDLMEKNLNGGGKGLEIRDICCGEKNNFGMSYYWLMALTLFSFVRSSHAIELSGINCNFFSADLMVSSSKNKFTKVKIALGKSLIYLEDDYVKKIRRERKVGKLFYSYREEGEYYFLEKVSLFINGKEVKIKDSIFMYILSPRLEKAKIESSLDGEELIINIPCSDGEFHHVAKFVFDLKSKEFRDLEVFSNKVVNRSDFSGDRQRPVLLWCSTLN